MKSGVLAAGGVPSGQAAGTMWLSQCQSVAFDYDGNQGVFKDVSQCTERHAPGCPTAALTQTKA